ncbi:MAG: (2Fe-2S)-binding protein [Methylococcales bacterium]
MFSSPSLLNAITVNITIDGRPIQVPQDITVAAAVLSNGLRNTRATPVSGAARAPFCMMGVCFDCLMVIDGISNQRACSTRVNEGMRIESQHGVGPEIEKSRHG